MVQYTPNVENIYITNHAHWEPSRDSIKTAHFSCSCIYLHTASREGLLGLVMMVAATAGMGGLPIELLHGRENEERGHAQSQTREHSPDVCRLADLRVVAPRLESSPRISLCRPRLST